MSPRMKIKAWSIVLVSAITLYVASLFCHMYESTWQGMLPVITYPYRVYAIPLAVIATVDLAAAAVLFSKSK